MNRRAAEIKAREQNALKRIKQRNEELQKIKRNTNVNVIPMAHVENNNNNLDDAQFGKYINNNDGVDDYDINLTNVDNNINNGISIENPQKFDYSYLKSLFTKKPVAQEIISHTGSYNLTELANAGKVNTGGKSKKNKKNRKNKKTNKLNKKIKKTRKLNKRRK
jgi:hypothetical protein